MDMPGSVQLDAFSDYGSDFAPDEEEILDALLHQTAEQDDQHDAPSRDPDLLLKDIEGEKGPRGARVPRRQGQQSQDCPPLLLSTTRITIQLDGGNHCSTNSTFDARELS